MSDRIRKKFKGEDIFNTDLLTKEKYNQLITAGVEPQRKLLYFYGDNQVVFGAICKYSFEQNGEKFICIDMGEQGEGFISKAKFLKEIEFHRLKIKCSKCGYEMHPDEFNVRTNKNNLIRFTKVCAKCNNKKRQEQRDNERDWR